MLQTLIFGGKGVQQSTASESASRLATTCQKVDSSEISKLKLNKIGLLGLEGVIIRNLLTCQMSDDYCR